MSDTVSSMSSNFSSTSIRYNFKYERSELGLKLDLTIEQKIWELHIKFGHGVDFSACVLSGAHEGKERTTYIVYNGNIET